MAVVNGGFTFGYGVAYSFGDSVHSGGGTSRTQSNSYAIPYRIFGIG